MDLTDNDLKKLGNFPPMKRLKCILASNNRISRIDHDLPKYLPNLNTLVLINNEIEELGELDVLKGFKYLEYLSLMGNSVISNPHYRHYLIHKCPKLRVLDFKRITLKVSTPSSLIFKGKRSCKTPLCWKQG